LYVPPEVIGVPALLARREVDEVVAGGEELGAAAG
jgi:hypothetical protein